jgi:SOS response regulatory protein OraA/RecX
VEQELAAKGIARELVAAALDASYPPSRELEVARQLAAERWARLSSSEPEARRRRTVDHLLRRGFRAGLAADAVRRAEHGEGALG